MSAEWIEYCFPHLQFEGYQITSPESPRPNCIGYALHSNMYFDPGFAGSIGGYYWPEGITANDTVAAWIELFRLHNYTVCDGPDPEIGFERIAIYGDATGEATHVARQLPSGAWTSKLGKLEDIEHQSLGVLAGRDYGTVVTFMRRPHVTSPHRDNAR